MSNLLPVDFSLQDLVQRVLGVDKRAAPAQPVVDLSGYTDLPVAIQEGKIKDLMWEPGTTIDVVPIAIGHRQGSRVCRRSDTRRRCLGRASVRGCASGRCGTHTHAAARFRDARPVP